MRKVHALRHLHVSALHVVTTKCGENGFITKTVDGIMTVQTSWEFIEVAVPTEPDSRITCGMCLIKLRVPT